MDMQILLAEDHLTIRKLLVNILRQQGFSKFLQADNGANNYIIKPFTPKIVRQKIEAIFMRR